MNEDLGKKVTIFPNIWKTKEPHYISIQKVLDRIKNGNSKEKVQQIRAESDKNKRNELKKELPSICFSGIFKYRDNHGIDSHSGFICLDFDHVKNIEKFKESLRGDRYIFSYFLSPSGDGIKVIVKIPSDIKKHSSYFEALRLYFRMEDYLGWDELKDIARVCYESYDPDLYLNENSKVFDIEIKPKPVVVEFAKDGEKIKDDNEVYKRIKRWADRTNEYCDGNKHNFLVYISSACNRFGLSAEFVCERLVEDYQEKASFVESGDFKDIVKRVYITYSNQHGISYFTTNGEMSDFDPEAPARDVIYLSSIRNEMINSFLKGDAKGETTYFNSIDSHWRWKRGEINLMHGLPNHGKSTLTLQLMLIKSIKEGVKWGVFSPEQNPPIDFYKELIHMYIGKTTEHYMPNQMSLQEYNMGIDFMNEHFFFVYPKDESPTPQYIADRFDELIIKHNIQGCLTDPFNQLDNDWATSGGRDDLYISAFLSKEKRFALDRDIYKIIIAHPKGAIAKVTEKNQDSELENAGNYECPDVYDLAGGAMWNNKTDNILCTYQPYYHSRIKARKDERGNRIVETKRIAELVQFRSQKIKKQKLIGQPGTANLVFDLITARYYEENMADYTKKLSYCPFDKEYKQNDIFAGETKIEETDWESFKQWDSDRKKADEEKEKTNEADRLEELGLYDDNFFDSESYDMPD